MDGRPDRDLHPAAGGPPRALAVVLHPHPGMGGDRHHPLVVAVADGLAAAGVAALRLDLIDPDVTASAERLVEVTGEASGQLGVDRVVLVGYSWGSVVSAAAQPGGLVGRVLVAPPVGSMALAVPDALPLLALVPAHDQFGPPDVVRAALDGRAATTVEVVDGCDHFLAGAVSRIAARTVEWVAELQPA